MDGAHSIRSLRFFSTLFGWAAIALLLPSVRAQQTSNPGFNNPGLTSGIQPATPPSYTPPSYGPQTFSDAGNSAALQNSMDALNDNTKLNPGDTLSYRVIEEQDPQPESLTISDAGEIEVPLLGRFQASGKTCKEIAAQLKPMLEKNYFYKATVIVALQTRSTRPNGRVFLTGQVKAQGAIDIPSNETMTVSRAVLLDGGLADFADRRRIRLLHRNADGTTKTTIVDLKEVLDRGHSEKDPVVVNGDTINVPEKLINF